MNFVGADSMGAIVPTACGGDAIIFAPTSMSLIKSTKEDTKRANMRAKNCSVSASKSFDGCAPPEPAGGAHSALPGR